MAINIEKYCLPDAIFNINSCVIWYDAFWDHISAFVHVFVHATHASKRISNKFLITKFCFHRVKKS